MTADIERLQERVCYLFNRLQTINSLQKPLPTVIVGERSGSSAILLQAHSQCSFGIICPCEAAGFCFVRPVEDAAQQSGFVNVQFQHAVNSKVCRPQNIIECCCLSNGAGKT